MMYLFRESDETGVLRPGIMCLLILISTVRCVHCSIHLGSFWSPLGDIFVALGSILVALGSPGFPKVTFCTFWATFATIRIPLGSTLEHVGSPRVSSWSFYGILWHHLGNLGHLVEIAIFP